MSGYGTAVESAPANFSEAAPVPVPTNSPVPVRPAASAPSVSTIVISLPTETIQAFATPAATSWAKRAMDVSVALLLLILLLPSLMLIALAVRVTSPGPILFRQSRTGLNGRVFAVWKFRTMRVLEDGDGIAHATRNDARVTPIGALLRSTSLDELPQLFNVLAGDMSLVGPRPHAVAHDRRYGLLIGDYARRFRAKPGMTGLAQIRGLRGEIHDLSCMEARVRADCEYIERWSLFFDLAILLQTIPLMVRDRNAY